MGHDMEKFKDHELEAGVAYVGDHGDSIMQKVE